MGPFGPQVPDWAVGTSAMHCFAPGAPRHSAGLGGADPDPTGTLLQHAWPHPVLCLHGPSPIRPAVPRKSVGLGRVHPGKPQRSVGLGRVHPGKPQQSAGLGRAPPGKAPDWARRTAAKRQLGTGTPRQSAALGLARPGTAPAWARRAPQSGPLPCSGPNWWFARVHLAHLVLAPLCSAPGPNRRYAGARAAPTITDLGFARARPAQTGALLERTRHKLVLCTGAPSPTWRWPRPALCRGAPGPEQRCLGGPAWHCAGRAWPRLAPCCGAPGPNQCFDKVNWQFAGAVPEEFVFAAAGPVQTAALWGHTHPTSPLNSGQRAQNKNCSAQQRANKNCHRVTQYPDNRRLVIALTTSMTDGQDPTGALLQRTWPDPSLCRAQPARSGTLPGCGRPNVALCWSALGPKRCFARVRAAPTEGLTGRPAQSGTLLGRAQPRPRVHSPIQRFAGAQAAPSGAFPGRAWSQLTVCQGAPGRLCVVPGRCAGAGPVQRGHAPNWRFAAAGRAQSSTAPGRSGRCGASS